MGDIIALSSWLCRIAPWHATVVQALLFVMQHLNHCATSRLAANLVALCRKACPCLYPCVVKGILSNAAASATDTLTAALSLMKLLL